MKRSLWLTSLFAFITLFSFGQEKEIKTPNNNTLLWRITGKNITKPSYLFGTMHMICADDIGLSDSLVKAISNADKVYLELDMDNLFEMMGAMGQMKMLNDTTLADLLDDEEYEKVKNFFSKKSPIPFSMLETYKPLLASSMIIEMQTEDCDKVVSMEELIMNEARKNDIGINGLETMGYQLSIFDSIPYKFQAKQLLKMIDGNDSEGENDMKEIIDAYRNQQLEKMEILTKKEDMGIENFTQLLLYNRNSNWAKKIDGLINKQSLVIAVGAGHLPGERGVINLLRNMGYKVEPVKNIMIRKKTREI